MATEEHNPRLLTDQEAAAALQTRLARVESWRKVSPELNLMHNDEFALTVNALHSFLEMRAALQEIANHGTFYSPPECEWDQGYRDGKAAMAKIARRAISPLEANDATPESSR